LEHVGIWEVSAESAAGLLTPTVITELACNLANPRETDIRTPAELQSAAADPLRAGWFTRPVWFYCAIAALLLAFIEWSLYQRRLIRLTGLAFCPPSEPRPPNASAMRPSARN
jgi:hypothetical protein